MSKKAEIDKFVKSQGKIMKNWDFNPEFSGVVAAANQEWRRDTDMRPGNLFQILDLPICDSFLHKHGETLNKVLFKKDLALYKEINIDLDAINSAFG